MLQVSERMRLLVTVLLFLFMLLCDYKCVMSELVYYAGAYLLWRNMIYNKKSLIYGRLGRPVVEEFDLASCVAF